jgi:hypothetical protein
MALVVLRRYTTLSEAQAAAAALRASGLYAVLLDEAGTPPYSGMPVMGGFRLAVPDDEARDAVEALRGALAVAAHAEAVEPEAGEAPDEPWWEETAGSNRPVMPSARRAGQVVVWAWFVLSALMFVLSLWSARGAAD